MSDGRDQSLIESRNAIQKFVLRWAVSIYGDDATDLHERAMRMLEEAMELAQAFGIGRKHASLLVARVWDRKIGDPGQELGGAAVTLMALAEAASLSLADCERREINRVLELDPEELRRSRDTKVVQGISKRPGVGLK